MFLEVFIQGAIVVIHGVPMNSAIHMDMRDIMTVRLAVIVGVAVRKTVVIVTGVTSRGLGGRNKRSLERKRQRGRRHYDDGKPPHEGPVGEAQLSASSLVRDKTSLSLHQMERGSRYPAELMSVEIDCCLRSAVPKFPCPDIDLPITAGNRAALRARVERCRGVVPRHAQPADMFR